MTDEQLAFDIEGMIHEAAVAAAPQWTGAPLRFTTAYHPPAALDAAMEHWQFLHGHHGSSRTSHMWHRALAVPGGVDLGDHGFDFFTADLRCDPWEHETKAPCPCVGDLMYLAICEPHGWHGIADEVAERLRPHPNGATAMRELARAPERRPIGCTQITEILNTPGIVGVGPLPGEFALAAVYAVGIATASPHPEPARQFVGLLTGAAAGALRGRLGFSAAG